MLVRLTFLWRVVLSGLIIAGCLSLAPRAQAQPFDLDNGHAPIQIVIPAIIPVLFTYVAPGDATLVLRTTTLVTNGFFDAIAPYHASAVGVYSRLPRRPAAEGTTERNRNIALIYASREILNSLYPREQAVWDAMVSSAGLDPAAQSSDLSTPIGIGLAAGRAVVAARERDGMNQLGDAGGRLFNRVPYADYTGYKPVNSAYELRDPTRWQPNITTRGNGIYAVQQSVTPQYALTRPYSYADPKIYRVAPPTDSQLRGAKGRAAYKAQADQVLAVSAMLTDAQKLSAELFDNKIESLGFVALFLSLSRGWSVEEFVHYDFLVNMAAYDAGMPVWQEKRRFDAVRPFSAIRYLYGDGLVQAWGGVGVGTTLLPADQWASYLPPADHSEYPSGSACFCAAHAQASRRYLGSDMLGWQVPYPAGSSRIEPGITPATDTVLTFNTWSQFEDDCGQSRLWAGVHFQAAIDAPKAICTDVGDKAYDFLVRHIDGTAPPPQPPGNDGGSAPPAFPGQGNGPPGGWPPPGLR